MLHMSKLDGTLKWKHAKHVLSVLLLHVSMLISALMTACMSSVLLI